MAGSAPRDRSQRVVVHGLPELKRGLRQVDRAITKDMGKEFRGVADEVAEKIRAKMPHKKGRAKGSVVGRGTQDGARIEAGGTKAEYFHWLDFGGSVGRGHKPKDYWSGAIKRDWMGVPRGSGRYVYPTIKEERGDIEDAARDVVTRAGRRAGFDVERTL